MSAREARTCGGEWLLRAEMGGPALVQPGPPKAPNAASVNATTGVYTWNTTGATMSTGTGANAETLYSTQVVIEDRTAPSAGSALISKSTIDFFIRIALTTTNNAPQFVAPSPASGTVFSVPAGQNLSFTVKASDADTLDAVSLNVIGLPAGASFPLPAPGNPAQATFSWTPTVGQIGSYAMTFTASDGKTSTTLSVGINVGALGNSKSATPISGPNPPEVGATSFFDVFINLNVPATSPSSVLAIQVTDPLPASVAFQSIVAPSKGTASYDGANNQVLWNVGTLGAGQSAQLVFRVSVTPTAGNLGQPMPLNLAATATGTFGGVPITVVSNTVQTAPVAPPSNQPPIANAGGPYTVEEGGSVTLNGSGSDPNGDPLTFSWDLDNNGSFETPGQNVTFSAGSLDAPTSRTVVLQVCDNKGACATSSASVSIVPPPTPPFSINPPVPPGTCICTPLLMNTNSGGAEHLFFKAGPSGTADLRLYATSVNATDPETAVARVFDTVSGLQVGPTLTASYPAGTAPGTEVSADGSYPTVVGRVYRVKVTTPNASPQQPHYRIRFNGVVGAAINSPTFASIEHANTVRWFLNHSGGDLKLRVFSQGVPTPLTPETETVHVAVFGPAPFSPTAAPILNQTVNVPNPPGIDQVFTAPGAAAGQYRVNLQPVSHHYRLEKQGGADTAIYLGAATSGFGSLSGTIQTSSGAPFPGNVQVNLLRFVANAWTQEATTTTSTGAYTFSKVFVGPHRVEIVPPPGTNLVSASFFDVFVSCEQTAAVPPFVLNRPPVVTVPATTTLNEGSSAVIAATGSDPDGNTLTFTWTLTGPGTLTPSGSTATYSNADGPATATVEVTVTDGFGGAAKATGSVQTMNVAPTATATGATINENGTATVSGSITDPSPLDTFTVVINWGPGEGSTTLNLPAGATSYSATHQYLDDNPTGTPSDVNPVSVTVTDDDGGAGNAATTVTVNNVAPVITGLTATPLVALGNLTNLNGTFTDVGTKDTHTASVDWGDSTASTAAVTETNGSGSFAASHTYTIAQFYTITVTLKDDDTGTATQQIKVTVTATGKMTGGGRVDTGLTQPGNGKAPPQPVHTSHGFEMWVNADLSIGGNLEYNDPRNGAVFHVTSFTSIVFIDDPALKPGNPGAKFDTAIAKGVGRLNGVDGVQFEAVITDNGEPGKTDTFKISFPGGQSPGISGVLVVGNHQAHPLP